MRKINVEDAKNQLGELLDDALHGEDVVITRHGQPVARLVSIPPERKPRFGSAAGKLQITDDFDAPLPDFAEYGS